MKRICINKSSSNVQTRILFVSFNALSGDLAWQVKKEGSKVKYFIQSPSEKDVCDGFVDKVDNWGVCQDWADVIVFDDIGFGGIASKLRKDGKLVIGGSVYTDKLECNRNFGQKEMRKAGISTLPCWKVNDFDSAINFLKENPGRYVIKPNSKLTDERPPSFVGQNGTGNDLIEILDRYKDSEDYSIESIQIQKFVSGVEVAVGAFFNGLDFISPINVNFEYKRMFPGDIGPNIEEMGTFMFWSSSNKIFDETLKKMRNQLASSGYVGYIDINCIVNARGIYPLEFTSRFGYPTISVQMEGILNSWFLLLTSIAKGQNFRLQTKKGFQIGVVIAVPAFPFYSPSTFRRQAKGGTITFKKPIKGIHLGDVKFTNGKWRLAGESGYTLVITGSGTTMRDARKQAYRRVSNIIIPNLFYRNDIGLRWRYDYKKLHNWGYLP